MHLPPPVPIKTYRWEDLRRARIRGGYPWTHLDKPPLDSPAWKDTRYVVTYDLQSFKRRFAGWNKLRKRNKKDKKLDRVTNRWIGV